MSTTLLVAELMRFVVLERLQLLRQRSYAELQALPEETAEDVTIEDRQVPITVSIRPVASERLRVVVQGWVESRFAGTSVFTDGFLKKKDEGIEPMGERDFEEYV